LVVTELERREEKMLVVGLPVLAPLLVDGAVAVAVVLVTEGAEGCARLKEAGVRRVGAATLDDGMVFSCL
jgi:hypothetical protein